jgi:hypothetical protein
MWALVLLVEAACVVVFRYVRRACDCLIVCCGLGVVSDRPGSDQGLGGLHESGVDWVHSVLRRMSQPWLYVLLGKGDPNG